MTFSKTPKHENNIYKSLEMSIMFLTSFDFLTFLLAISAIFMSIFITLYVLALDQPTHNVPQAICLVYALTFHIR